MRNLKKFFALVLAMLMIVSATAVVSADFTDVAADNIYGKAINDLVEKKITAGSGDGTTFTPDGLVTRWQMALFVARSMTGEVDNTVWANGISIFDDVNDGHYKGAISHAYLNGVILGVGDNKFNPEGNITYGAALKMAVCALGYDVKYTAATWALDFYGKAQELGLTAGVAVYDLDKELTRAETAQIIYNMIYAAPAEGELTMAEENFAGIVGVVAEELFVITATPKQAYENLQTTTAKYQGTLIDGSKYVTLQALVNGLPSGEGVDFLASDLGIAAEDVEDYFNRSVVLTNYKAAGKKFDSAILGKAPVAVRDSAVTYNKNSAGAVVSYTIDGTTYELADKLADSNLKNTLVVLSLDTDAGIAQKELIIDKDGYVLDPTTYNKVALFIITTNAGENIYKLVDGDTVGATISEADLLATYGVDSAGYTDATYATASSLSGEYVIYLYDDYGDARYERATVENVYLTSYYTYEATISNKKTVCDAVVKVTTGADVAAADVTYTDEDVKTAGTIFTYTYNAALKKVTVLDTDIAVKKTDAALTSFKAASGKYSVVLGGVTYDLDADGDINAVVGANVLGRNVGKTADLAAFEKGEYLTVSSTTLDALKSNMGKKFNFYAIGSQILYIEEVEAPTEGKLNFVVYAGFNDLEADDVLVDLYVGGELKKAASLYAWGDDVISEFTKNVELTAFVTKIMDTDNIAPGSVYAVEVVDGAYNLKYPIIHLEDDATPVVNATNAGKAGLIAVDTTSDIVFDAKGMSNGTNATKILVNSDTVFYFINDDGDLATTTDAKESRIAVFTDLESVNTYVIGAGSTVFVDKQGLTGSNKGVASVVLVYNATDATDFGGTTSDPTIKLVTTVDNNNKTSSSSNLPSEYASAESFGLDIANAKTTYLYKYTAAALELATGNTIDLYSASELKYDTIYVADEQGIVTSTGTVDLTTISVADTDYVYTDGKTYIEIFGNDQVIIDTANNVTAIKLIDMTSGKIVEGASDVKATLEGLVATGKTGTIYEYMTITNGVAIVLYKPAA